MEKKYNSIWLPIECRAFYTLFRLVARVYINIVLFNCSTWRHKLSNARRFAKHLTGELVCQNVEHALSVALFKWVRPMAYSRANCGFVSFNIFMRAIQLGNWPRLTELLNSFYFSLQNLPELQLLDLAYNSLPNFDFDCCDQVILTPLSLDRRM